MVFKWRNIEFRNAPKSRGRFMGVYMIGDFYVGASTHILNRIKGRYREYLRDLEWFKEHGFDKDLITCPDIFWYFQECTRERKSPVVTILSDNPLQEIRFKQKYNIPLKNKEKCFHEDSRFIKLYTEHKLKIK